MKNKENVKYGNIPVGETFEFEGKEYIVKGYSRVEYDKISRHVVESVCNLCAFDKNVDGLCNQLCCAWFERRDETDAYFVEKK